MLRSPLQRRGGAAVLQDQLFLTLKKTLGSKWFLLHVCMGCFININVALLLSALHPFCPGLFCYLQLGSILFALSRELVSSHLNWLKKCLRSHASAPHFPAGVSVQRLFIVRSLRFRHPSLLSSFKTGIVQIAGALLMNMSDLTFLNEQTSH